MSVLRLILVDLLFIYTHYNVIKYLNLQCLYLTSKYSICRRQSEFLMMNIDVKQLEKSICNLIKWII